MIARFGDLLRAAREGRKSAWTGDDTEKADRMAKQSLNLGIISLVSVAAVWIPVVGGILFLASVPVGIIAIARGQKAKKMGSEKRTGVIFGAVALGLFLIGIALALLLAFAFLYGL